MPPSRPPAASRLAPFTVGDWLVDPRACRLSRGEAVVKLRPQLADLLVCLASRSGDIVLREEILAEVWGSQYIAESGLSRCIAELRQALGDDAQEPRLIETIPRRGYRLMVPAAFIDEPDPSVSAKPVSEPALPDPPVAAPPQEDGPVGVPRAPRRRRGARVAALVAVLAVGASVAVLLRPRSGVLTSRDTLVLAFENRTGDAVFDETIPLAVSIQLEQSPYLAILSSARITEVLRMMKRSPDTPVTRALGLEIGERSGARALIVASIALLGRQYAVGLEAVACEDGRVLARRQVTAGRKEAVLDALARAAVDIRRAVGEPTGSISSHAAATEATTPSLEALRLVRRGDAARERGDTAVAMGFFRDAVALDPEFALAHSRLGAVAAVEGSEAEALSAFERAYTLRQQVTLPERLEIEASYHRYVTGEQARAVEVLELLKRSYPTRAFVRRSLVVAYTNAGRYDEALAEALDAHRLEPNSAMNMAAAARAHLYLNQLAEAIRLADAAIAQGGSSPTLYGVLFQAALASRDEALLARVRQWEAGHPEAMPYWVDVEAEEALNRGRLRDAVALLHQWEAAADGAGFPATASMVRLRAARYEALCGLAQQAMQRAEAERARHGFEPSLRMDVVKVAISAGRFDRAEELLDEMARDGWPGTSQPGATFAPAYRAAIAASRGRPDRALELLGPLQPFELGLAYGFIPLFERAKVHDQLGDWSNARLAFEAILAHSTIDSGRKLLPFAELGLARTLARAGDTARSRRAYEQFFDRWRQADPDLPVLAEARREYGALPK